MLLLLMNCQQFNLLKTYRGIYILGKRERDKSHANLIPSLPMTVAREKPLPSQTTLGARDLILLKMLATS